MFYAHCEQPLKFEYYASAVLCKFDFKYFFYVQMLQLQFQSKKIFKKTALTRNIMDDTTASSMMLLLLRRRQAQM